MQDNEKQAPSQLDYYQLLGLTPKATPTEIKKAWRKLAQKFHPDRSGGSEEAFRELKRAYETLADPQRRLIYDQGIRQGFSFVEFQTYLNAAIEQISNAALAKAVNSELMVSMSLLDAAEASLAEMKEERTQKNQSLRDLHDKLIAKMEKIKKGHESLFYQSIDHKRAALSAELERNKITLAVYEYLEADLSLIEVEPEEFKDPLQVLGADPFRQISSSFWRP